jgi:hypothetical protein
VDVLADSFLPRRGEKGYHHQIREANYTATKNAEMTMTTVSRGPKGWLWKADVLDDIQKGPFKRLITVRS